MNFSRLVVYFALVMSGTSFVYGAETKWSMDGDSAKHDLGKKIFRYHGNARFENDLYLIQGESLESIQPGNLNKRQVTITGLPAKVVRKSDEQGKLTLSAEEINFQAKSKNLNATRNIVLNLKNIDGSLKLEGENLLIKDSAKGLISVEGAPGKLVLMQSDGSTIDATALKIEFEQSSQIFTLHGNVVLKTERESISAAKIIYDMKNKTLEIPKVPNKRVEMIQKVKS